MKKYLCSQCDYVYDPAKGIAADEFDADTPVATEPDEVFYDHNALDVPPGTDFADLPDQWVCPRCGMHKAEFKLLAQ